jgi:NADPH:quinone reductase-like Zn-dependent oxidoreductase
MSPSTSIPDKIQAIVIGDQDASVQSIAFGSTPLVKNLDPSAIIVRVRAVGLNPTDWKHAFGDWGKPGRVSGCDAAGDIVKVGSEVKHLKVGDRVAGFNTYGGTHETTGAFAEYVWFNSALVFKLPEGMSYEEAASFPIPHYTAVQALYLRMELSWPSVPAATKHTILIWGGSTAVGHHAIQLAHLSGLRVFITASSSAHASLKELGADKTFDYKDLDVVEKIKAAGGSGGITLALDTVSEKGSTEKIIDSMGSGGGKVITLLPISDEIANRRPDVSVELTLAYTLGGHEVLFARKYPFPAIPEDKERIGKYLTKELPILLEGWKEGGRSPKFKTQSLRKIEGDSWHDAIFKGMRIMQSGDYGREKLVVSMA